MPVISEVGGASQLKRSGTVHYFPTGWNAVAYERHFLANQNLVDDKFMVGG